MGHSFGGILAVNYAYLYPERTKSLILSNVTLHMVDSFRHQMIKGSEILGKDMKVLSYYDIKSLMDQYYSLLSELLEQNEYFNIQI